MLTPTPSPQILYYEGLRPQIHESAWIAPGAVITGDTVISAHATVLFGCVLRGDINRVRVGEGSNIQDLSLLHVADAWECIVGAEVTVGHCAVLHGCVVEDGCLIGMGARVLNGAVVGRGSIVAAGALVPEGMQVPSGSIVAGLPATIKGKVTRSHLEKLGALDELAKLSGIPEHLCELPGVAFARKYRLVARAYRQSLAAAAERD